ncbi:MAG: molybdopterin molybdotransferase MoeA [Ferrovum myxofaciens]|uniref:molybdopterin molybdotransferase MoeA n=1 Tax=Ferrovum myxofaciens TaxID=416213 RepID=UPI0023528D69|nr:gephyrin-like molybdotransferase Glp [Ferrovum myxofaciens]QKE40397.1 MAG: molybdopterin molybdotransferase MoeA [Ferrovum myxofaciens]
MNPLSPEVALERLIASIRTRPATEIIPLEQSQGRVLAEDLCARCDLPPDNVSMMDGYAVRITDLDDRSLPISQRIPAGRSAQPLAPQSVARLFTGACLPLGADAVVMQEDSALEGSEVRFTHRPHLGQHIRLRGEDARIGDVVRRVGSRVRPQDMGLLAAVGIESVVVYCKLSLAVFFTGDELVQPGHPLEPGQIYNSNHFLLRGLLEALHCNVVDLGVVPDNLDQTLSTLTKAASAADIILTCGGVSVGEEDHVRTAVEQIGQIDLWRVAIKPGKPFASGQVNGVPFLGLPGNPVSAFVVFCLFVRPFILSSQGALDWKPQTYQIRANFEWPQVKGRTEWLRAQLHNDEEGTFLTLVANQGSASLTSLVQADGLVEIPMGRQVVRGDTVRFMPFSGLLI